jgi:hypothetical protein
MAVSVVVYNAEIAKIGQWTFQLQSVILGLGTRGGVAARGRGRSS